MKNIVFILAICAILSGCKRERASSSARNFLSGCEDDSILVNVDQNKKPYRMEIICNPR